MAITPGLIIDLGTVTNTTLITAETPITSSSMFGTKTILTTATLVNAALVDLVGRSSVAIQNNTLNNVYISNSNLVSSTAGILVAPGSTVTLNVDRSVDTPLYAISINIPSLVSITEV